MLVFGDRMVKVRDIQEAFEDEDEGADQTDKLCTHR